MEAKIKTIFIECEDAHVFNSKIVHGNTLAERLEDTCNELTGKGYKISSILPLVSGNYHRFDNYDNVTRIYGYSYTSGIIVVATKI